MASPRLTIAIPTYNRSGFLRKNLRSVQAAVDFAKADDVEVLVVDNASTDDTSTVILESAAGFRNFKHSRNSSNIGANLNVAKCVASASGDYLWCLGDDDFVAADCLVAILDCLRKGYDYVIANFSSIFAKTGKVLTEKHFPINDKIEFLSPNEAMGYLHYMPGFISCVIARREILGSITDEQVRFYAKLHFNQLFAFYHGIVNQSKGIILPHILFVNCVQDGDYHWEDAFVQGLGQVFSDLKASGYSRSARQAAKSGIMRRIIQPKILQARLEGQPVSRCVGQLWRHYRTFPRFWLVCMPVLLCPNSLLKIANSVRQSCR